LKQSFVGCGFLSKRQTDIKIENSQRAHSPVLAAGLASELKMKKFSLNLGDSPQLAAGFFKYAEISNCS